MNVRNAGQSSVWLVVALVASALLWACEGESSAICDANPCFSRGCPGFPGDLACGVGAAGLDDAHKARRGCDEGCPGDAPLCDREQDRCVACFRHSECGDDTFCDVFSGRCRTRCDTDVDCEGTDSPWCAEGYCRPDAEVQVWSDASFEAGYLRPEPLENRAEFGSSVALSADGRTLAAHAAFGSGAVEVWRQNDGGWERETRLLAGLYPDPQLKREYSLALSPDGNLLVVGDPQESSLDKGVFTTLRGGNETAFSAQETPGAAYVFERMSDVWRLTAVLKPSNTHRQQSFGTAVALANHGRLLAVGSPRERAASTGVGGAQTDLSAEDAGAVYIFERPSDAWVQTAYLKASDSAPARKFGLSLALSTSGSTLAVGAAENSIADGAAYVFESREGVWEEQHKLPDAIEDISGTSFGYDVALSGDGNLLAVSGPIGDPTIVEPTYPGAVRVFARAAEDWQQQAHLTPPRPQSTREFGSAVALSADGRTLVVGARLDGAPGTGVSSPDASGGDAFYGSGAAHVYQRFHREWAERVYVKHRFEHEFTGFGGKVALSASGSTLAVGARSDYGASIENVLHHDEDPQFRSGSVTVFDRARE